MRIQVTTGLCQIRPNSDTPASYHPDAALERCTAGYQRNSRGDADTNPILVVDKPDDNETMRCTCDRQSDRNASPHTISQPDNPTFLNSRQTQTYVSTLVYLLAACSNPKMDTTPGRSLSWYYNAIRLQDGRHMKELSSIMYACFRYYLPKISACSIDAPLLLFT